MAAWSALGRNILTKTFQNKLTFKNVTLQQLKDFSVTQIRNGGDHGPRTFTIVPSNWQWHKFKDIVHLYLMVGLIPCLGVVAYTNIFIGPAQLAPIPEGYEPKEWEYYRHPITRFIARYIMRNPQQEYEKMCHFYYEEGERQKMRRIEHDIKRKMAERLDYQAWYYRPIVAKYARQSKEHFEEIPLERGT